MRASSSGCTARCTLRQTHPSPYTTPSPPSPPSPTLSPGPPSLRTKRSASSAYSHRSFCCTAPLAQPYALALRPRASSFLVPPSTLASHVLQASLSFHLFLQTHAPRLPCPYLQPRKYARTRAQFVMSLDSTFIPPNAFVQLTITCLLCRYPRNRRKSVLHAKEAAAAIDRNRKLPPIYFPSWAFFRKRVQ